MQVICSIFIFTLLLQNVDLIMVTLNAMLLLDFSGSHGLHVGIIERMDYGDLHTEFQGN
jgi:hypothetical protein